ncbi:DnaA regulatory inactivator Hda [Corticibacter populi]|uniref:DnaA regulatory inactivator Hda n=1 Tax=Corticibacter populi TaxID=1550736 RepID=A0A3M6QMJ5_9BURK|nr:DnaA regulatory inactivator Hda [Corticibacter populi]RMX03622.1 DnaA regulatory inactivator Hda [Corticibacter populi]
MQQLALDIGMAPEPDFAHFLANGNQQAVECLQAGVQQLLASRSGGATGPTPSPVYLWGPPGAGKTHLLSAVALALQAHGLAVGWLRGRPLAGQTSHHEFDPDWAAVLLDDVDLYSAAQQQQAFNWFINASHPIEGAPRWVLASGACPVVNLEMREDLRSRLGWGLAFQLHVLDDGKRQMVLRQQAQERGLQLSDEVVQYLLSRYARDLASLSELLARLDAHALRTQRAITIPLLREMLQDGIPAPRDEDDFWKP